MIDTPTELFLVIEYVPGGELFDYIVRRGRVFIFDLIFPSYLRTKRGVSSNKSLVVLSTVTNIMLFTVI